MPPLLPQDTERFQRWQATQVLKAEREAAKELAVKKRQLKEEARLRTLEERAAKKEAADAEKEAKRQQRAVLKGLSRA